MMALLCLTTLALAEPGRTTAGATVGVVPETNALVLRGNLDDGLSRRFSLTSELGLLPGPAGAEAGTGPLLELVDNRWWRLGIAAFPAFTLPLDDGPAPGLALGGSGIGLVGHTGIRVGWLAFWGLSFTARLDHVVPLDAPAQGWTEVAGGLSLRM